MYLKTGAPFTGRSLEQLKQFLASCGLDYDQAISFTACMMDDDGEIIATASLDGATLKCIAVSPAHQGEDMTGQLLTVLRREAFDRGQEHLMLFTKPANQMMFASFGFYPVIRTSDCLLMESRRNGLNSFISGIASASPKDGKIGCIVANCNPFTNGHRYLIESAATQCDTLHLFILSEDKPPFPAKDRLMLVQKGVHDIKNVLVHPTGPYMVSSATFPSYFIKDKARVDSIYCDLDMQIFAKKIAPALNIKCRFVGSEPYCRVTGFYNEQMKKTLPQHGIELIEIPRCEAAGEAVSASRVRRLMGEGRMEEIRALVPETTYEYLSNLVHK